MKLIFDFSKDSDISDWNVVVDGVMGGKSTGNFSLNEEGYALFLGEISLANNGGFSSVQYDLPQMEVGSHKYIALRLKGDGKKYQFRVKNRDEVYYSYVHDFKTSGKWEIIKIPLEEMYPSFRGRKLNQPNFDHETIDQVAILIGNKKEESFQLLIDKIELE
ncbi:CIA30 family protein [Pontixanthobacter gangjinensis]